MRATRCWRQIATSGSRRALATEATPRDGRSRFNEVGVQLISSHLSEQLFGRKAEAQTELLAKNLDNIIALSKEHLNAHGLTEERRSNRKTQPSVSFNLPALQGGNIAEHFHKIGTDDVQLYRELAQDFANVKLPPRPQNWAEQPGWTKYYADGSFEAVEFPDSNADNQAICFDVETLYKETHYACMATAATGAHWFSWLSPWLLGLDENPEHLIPLPSSSAFPRLVIGHNVGYDRARIKEEYALSKGHTRYLDTMSLHIAVNGLSNPQRPAYIIHRKNKLAKMQREGEADTDSPPANLPWQDLVSMNSLAEVARLHCGITVDKSPRDFFGTGTRSEVRENVQDLLDYCASDVDVTHKVYCVVYPAFHLACPSPVSLAGVLHMGNSFLPVDDAWPKFVENAERVYNNLRRGVSNALDELAEKARSLMHGKNEDGENLNAWQGDPWLSQLDWSPKKARPKKSIIQQIEQVEKSETPLLKLSELDAENRLHIPLLLQATWRGFPVRYSPTHGWYFVYPPGSKGVQSSTHQKKLDGIEPTSADEKGARFYQISASKFNPKLEPGPLHDLFSPLLSKAAGKDVLDLRGVQLDGDKISPTDQERLKALASEANSQSVDQWKADQWLSSLVGQSIAKSEIKATDPEEAESTENQSEQSPATLENAIWPKWYWDLDGRSRSTEGEGLDMTVKTRAACLLLKLTWYEQPIFWSKEHAWVFRVPENYKPEDYGLSAELSPLKFQEPQDMALAEDNLHYFKLPHHNGGDANVGSPLSKGFLSAFEDGRLSSSETAAEMALDMNAQCSYWVSARERVKNTMVVWNSEDKNRGLVLPQVVTMGTVTRRAVESTWLTASNAKKNRVGSELRSLVHAPPGYAIVGADVDSEELWICSVMGDSYFGIHGATAIGWMTLEGSKSAGTDVHSTTGKILGISRDGAKVFNYSRLYGAGIQHAVDLLRKANPKMLKKDAIEAAEKLYANTKGVRNYRENVYGVKYWYGGSESFVFNKLENIATSKTPLTPALKCRITEALKSERFPEAENLNSRGFAMSTRTARMMKKLTQTADPRGKLPPGYPFGPTRVKKESNYLPSRINWVVQSSGVDYLHLLIVAIEYLIKEYAIDARYMISLHDEIRYLAKEEDKYRLALAMQIANLWVRAMFSFSLDMQDLPESCAFFSAVDIDHVFRKEVTMDCVTPSNPVPIPPGEALDMNQILAKTNATLKSNGESLPPSPLDANQQPYRLRRAAEMMFMKEQATGSDAKKRKVSRKS